MTLIVAHRGLGFGAPENSLDAARAVLDAGFGLEIDVRLTVDHALVVHHDPALAPGVAPIADLTRSELARLSASRGVEGPPDLESVLDVWSGASPGQRLLIEMKSAEGVSPAFLADAVLARVRGVAPDRFALMAFDWRAIGHALGRRPELLTLCLSPPGAARQTPAEIGHLGAGGWAAWREDLEAEAATQGRALGLSLAAWTVNDRAEMARLFTLGVDYLITDRPLAAAALRPA